MAAKSVEGRNKSRNDMSLSILQNSVGLRILFYLLFANVAIARTFASETPSTMGQAVDIEKVQFLKLYIFHKQKRIEKNGSNKSCTYQNLSL